MTALPYDFACLQRDHAGAIREVKVVEKTAPDGGVTRVTRLKLADKSLALTRFVRVCGIEVQAHQKGWAEGVQALLNRPEKEIVKRARERKARGGGDAATARSRIFWLSPPTPPSTALSERGLYVLVCPAFPPQIKQCSLKRPVI